MPKKKIKKKERCCLNDEPHHQCCCNCVNHFPDYSHPTTDGKPISHIRGYICHTELLGARSGWENHCCGCELYAGKDRYKLKLVYEKKSTSTL